MLNMGFYPQLQYIIGQTRPDRQTLLWTATWPVEVRELAKGVTSKPIKIDIGSEDLRTKENIKQEIIITGPRMQYCKHFVLIAVTSIYALCLYSNTRRPV